MKMFLLKQEDIDLLSTMIDRNPEHGQRGGSSQMLSEADLKAHREAHSFFNYQVRTWIAKVTA